MKLGFAEGGRPRRHADRRRPGAEAGGAGDRHRADAAEGARRLGGDRTDALRALAERLADDKAPGSFELDTTALAAPLPRAYQWADGSAYVVHVELVRKARGVEMPPSFWTDPLMYQGGSDSFIGPDDEIEAGDEAWGIDFEGEIGVIVDDVPMGVSPEAARRHIKLVTILNDVSLRNLIVGELAKGFGFFHGKPATAFAPVAVTPDELGDAWDGARLNLPLISTLNGKEFGHPNAATDLTFDFGQLIAHAAKTRAPGSRHHRGLGHRRQPRRRGGLFLHRRASRARDHRKRQSPHAVHEVRRSHPHRDVRRRSASRSSARSTRRWCTTTRRR